MAMEIAGRGKCAHTRARNFGSSRSVSSREAIFAACVYFAGIRRQIRDHLQSSCTYKTCTDKRSKTYPINMYESTVLIYNLIKNI